MEVAFYGGSFNPPHVAHAMVAAWLLWTRRVDAVWLVPVFRHAFEGVHDKSLAPFDQRLAWCRALAADVLAPGDQRIVVSDVEAHLPVPSFTIDTLRHLRAHHPDHRFSPVIGADVLPQLPRWRDWPGIQRDFPPIVVGRVGYDSPAGSVVFPEVSSSEVRRLLVAGRDPAHLLTAGVADALRAADLDALWGRRA